MKEAAVVSYKQPAGGHLAMFKASQNVNGLIKSSDFYIILKENEHTFT
jgi:hypothetical protein